MSLQRRLEIFMGGPARPIDLTAREADTLCSAMDVQIEQFQMEALRDGGDPLDPEIIENFRALRARLQRHAGYNPRPRKG